MADDKDLVNQDEIEALLQQSSGPPAGEPAPPESAAGSAADDPIGQDEIEALLNGAGGGGGETAPSSAPPPVAAPVVDDDDSDKLLGQDDIERLLNQAGAGPVAPTPKQSTSKEGKKTLLPGEGQMPQEDIAYLLDQAEAALDSIQNGGSGETPPGVTPFNLEEFSGAAPSAENATLDLIRNVDLDLKIELGRTNMYLEDVLKLRKGAVVPLDKLAGDPVDIYVNGRLIARGEVLVLNDNFCVRVAELVAGQKAG